MAFSDIYHKQVGLLMRALPYVAEESCFALKGGTAINLFIRNLPRLSVDIDLTYLPVAERGQSLTDIDAALKRIGERIREVDNNIHITESAPRSQNEITKLVVRTKDRVQIKIEVTPVLRGCVYDPVNMSVAQKTEDEFGFAEINVLSFADIYAGKIMAALDRQHPRDLFDVHQLLENEGITDELRTALIVYLISHDHSPHSLLDPVLRDISLDFEQNFLSQHFCQEILTLHNYAHLNHAIDHAGVNAALFRQSCFSALACQFADRFAHFFELALEGCARACRCFQERSCSSHIVPRGLPLPNAALHHKSCPAFAVL